MGLLFKVKFTVASERSVVNSNSISMYLFARIHTELISQISNKKLCIQK